MKRTARDIYHLTICNCAARGVELTHTAGHPPPPSTSRMFSSSWTGTPGRTGRSPPAPLAPPCRPQALATSTVLPVPMTGTAPNTPPVSGTMVGLTQRTVLKLHPVTRVRISFLFKAKQEFIMCTGHISFTHSLVNGRWACLHLLAAANRAAVNLSVRVPALLLHTHARAERLGHTQLTLRRTPRCKGRRSGQEGGRADSR